MRNPLAKRYQLINYIQTSWKTTFRPWPRCMAPVNPFFCAALESCNFSSKKDEHSRNIQACFILNDLELLFLKSDPMLLSMILIQSPCEAICKATLSMIRSSGYIFPAYGFCRFTSESSRWAFWTKTLSFRVFSVIIILPTVMWGIILFLY